MGIVKKQGIQNTVISYIGSVLGFVNKLLLFPKIFLLEQVGMLNVLLGFSVLYGRISGLGVYNVILKFFPHYKDKGKKAFFLLILKWTMVGFCVVSTIFYAFQPYIREVLFQKAPLLQNYFYWIVPFSFLILLFEVLESYSRALLKSVVPSFLRDFGLRFLMTTAILCYYFEFISFDLFVLLFAFTYLFAVLAMLAYLIYLGALKVGQNEQKLSLTQLFKFGFFVFLAESSVLLISTIDSLMLTSYTGLSAAGVYTTMIYLVSAFLIPYGALSKIAGPIIPRLWKENNTDQIQKLYVQFSRTNFFIGAVLFLLIHFNIELLFHDYGYFTLLPAAYGEGIIVFSVVGLARLFDVLYGINGAILVNSSRYKTDLVFVVTLVLLTILTNRLLIPTWGITGAVIASFISIVIINITRGIYLRNTFGFKLFDRNALLLVSIFALVFGVSFLLTFNNIWLTIGLRNIFLILGFITPVLALNLVPELKEQLLKTLRANK